MFLNTEWLLSLNSMQHSGTNLFSTAKSYPHIIYSNSEDICEA